MMMQLPQVKFPADWCTVTGNFNTSWTCGSFFCVESICERSVPYWNIWKQVHVHMCVDPVA